MSAFCTDPRHVDLVERLVRTRAELDQANALLRDIGDAEGDTSLAHMVHIWRQKAAAELLEKETLGVRMVLAERALRALLAGDAEAGQFVKAWQKEAG